MVGSEAKFTLDYHAVAAGYVPVVQSTPDRDFHLEVWRPNDSHRPFKDLRGRHKNLKMEYHVRRPGFPVGSRQNPAAAVVNTELWTFAHQSAIANADVLVAVRGTTGTERAVHIAEQLGVPSLPLRYFGGGAARAYAAMEDSLLKLPNGHVLSAAWSDGSASDLVGLIETVGVHSYFISYSHTQLEWCDLVHLALYTRGRTVLRDRSELRVGRPVQTKLLDAIGKAETFVLLWSAAAAESDWCRAEVQHALRLHRLGLPPRRLVVLRRDTTPPPDTLDQLLWLDAPDRRATDYAVNEVVDTERDR
ncbi:toll/interleukin-1 receptor domain-containing protein [bacterium]|nr:toll/interleukin-1 receptor domain-containing protein [bacterium]